MVEQWCYTTKKLGSLSSVNEDSYEEIWSLFRNFNIKIDFKIPEFDSKGKLHYHCLIYLPKNFYRKHLKPHGFSTEIVKCHDYNGWLQYSSKDLDKLDPLSIMFDKTL